jgi:hypothetical protein
MRLACLCLAALSFVPPARAAEPVTVELKSTAAVGTALVALGDVATVSGGDDATRARVARIDVAEFKPRENATAVGRKAVEYRLSLAGFDASAVRVTGAERAEVTLTRRPVTAEEVVAAARDELFRHYPNPKSLSIDLATPVVVKMPEVPVGEKVAVVAKPHGKPAAAGRVQMDVTVSAGGETLLSLAVHLNVQPFVALAPLPPLAPLEPPLPGASAPLAPPAAPGAPPIPPTLPPTAAVPPTPAGEVLVKPRQRVEVQVNSGGLKVTAVGEAQQPGKLGQTILVQNIDSKKTISARVTGPGTVEVDLGGAK